jgi:hypothetical protein
MAELKLRESRSQSGPTSCGSGLDGSHATKWHSRSLKYLKVAPTLLETGTS